MKIRLDLSTLPDELKKPAGELLEMIGVSVGGGFKVVAEQCVNSSISFENGKFLIRYRKKNEFFRSLTMLERAADGEKVEVSGNFDMLCYMADASRNAVPSVNGTKKLIRILASMGYDSMMLYTEDTYTIPGYPYFGRMRGRYSEEELCELDRYAEQFGLELIPCIQTLAHLGTAIRWPGLGDFSDTSTILMVGDERTYDFVRDALKTFARCFRSRRVNIGMDEAHELGLGRYLSKNGFRKRPEIMMEHLGRVAEICKECGFSPMMWSDMFYRMVFNGQYRVGEGKEVPKEIMDMVPGNVALVYWDYYQLNRRLFDHMVESHQKFNNEIVFAGGAWKWSGFAPHNRFSLASTKIQLDSCAAHNLKKIIVTGWGDDGGEASQFSTLPVLLYFSERLYGENAGYDVSRDLLDLRSKEVFGTGFDELLMFDLPNALPNTSPEELNHPVNPCKYLFYNDVLEGLFDKHVGPEASAYYADASQKLLEKAGNARFGYIYRTIGHLCSFLELKCDLGVRLTDAYLKDDRNELRRLASSVIPDSVSRLDLFFASFSEQWMSENKPFGLSEQELRIGGLRQRLICASQRVLDYLDGKVDRIEELEEPRLTFNGLPESGCPYILYHPWKNMVRSGV